jgi:hypothetical protein
LPPPYEIIDKIEELLPVLPDTPAVVSTFIEPAPPAPTVTVIFAPADTGDVPVK